MELLCSGSNLIYRMSFFFPSLASYSLGCSNNNFSHDYSVRGKFSLAEAHDDASAVCIVKIKLISSLHFLFTWNVFAKLHQKNTLKYVDLMPAFHSHVYDVFIHT